LVSDSITAVEDHIREAKGELIALINHLSNGGNANGGEQQ